MIELAPPQLDGEEVAHPCLYSELRQAPRETERIGQPEHRRVDRAVKMFAEVAPPEHELARQAFRTADVAVGFDPHAADHLPATFSYPLAQALEAVGMFAAEVLVELRLALGETVLRVLVHQMQDGMKSAADFAPRLRQRPQPSRVEMRMTGGVNAHRQRLAGGGDAPRQRICGRFDAGVDMIRQRLAHIERIEGRRQRIEQAGACRMIGIQQQRGVESRARLGEKSV